jgi:hypothetical protein
MGVPMRKDLELLRRVNWLETQACHHYKRACRCGTAAQARRAFAFWHAVVQKRSLLALAFTPTHLQQLDASNAEARAPKDEYFVE